MIQSLTLFKPTGYFNYTEVASWHWELLFCNSVCIAMFPYINCNYCKTPAKVKTHAIGHVKKCYRWEAYNARYWFCTSYTCICICIFVLLWLQKDLPVPRQNRGLFNVILMREKKKPPLQRPRPTSGRPYSWPTQLGAFLPMHAGRGRLWDVVVYERVNYRALNGKNFKCFREVIAYEGWSHI